MKLKTNKAILSRVKVTRRGKLVRRSTNQSHFNAKESGKQGRAKHSSALIKKVDIKSFKKYLPNY